MKTDKILPMNDLKIFGIYKDGRFTIPEEQITALKNGMMTDVVELKNLKGKDLEIESLPARLSIVKGEDGLPALRIDPVYREPNAHPKLSMGERQQLIRSELANLKKSYVDNNGNVQTEIIEYDQDTRQFMSYHPRAVKAPETVNGQTLTSGQKKKFREGEVVNLEDGTEFQLNTSSKSGLRSNRSGLVLSVILDGGISYLLFTGLKTMLGKKSEVEQSYSKGYHDGIREVQKQIERRIAINPRDRDAIRDFNVVRQELSKMVPNQSSHYKRMDYDDAKRFNSIDTEEGRNPKLNQERDENSQRRI